MPIEVRELVIRATVDEAAQEGRSAHTASNNNVVTSKEEIIKTCVDRVLEILRERRER